MASSTTTNKEVGELKIESTNIQTAAGVELSAHQKTLVGSVLDLFAGRPSLAKLQLWADNAVFSDPITIAKGRAQYEPQWYGLQSAFSEIERLSLEVTSAGNPITMDMKTRYKVKGLGSETVMTSVVNIFTEGDKISKVEDKWDNKLPEGSIANVSSLLRVAPGYAWYAWSLTWETSVWRAFRRLNAVSVPKMISVPKNAEEDQKRGN